MIQCIQPDFLDHILSIVGSSGVDTSRISFEITESVGAEDYNLLSTLVRQLRRAGFRVCMDDYGTGYSNMLALFSMDFDVIKIDKSILWGAQESELGRVILENSIRMIRQIQKQPLLLHLTELTRELYRDSVNDNQLQESLEEKGLLKYASRLMQILHEQTLLEEGYMPLLPTDDRGTRQIRKLITNHLTI